jgi:hypothetical protein
MSSARASLLAALAAMFWAVGCRSTGPENKPESVAVPAVDAGTANAEPSAEAGAPSSGEGWLRAEGQLGPKHVDRAEALAAMKEATHRALLVHDEQIEECSGAGGSHAFFTMAEPANGVIHFGGHGAFLINAFQKGELWVASYEKLPQPESVKNAGWCVPDRTIDGRAIAMVPVASREEGERLLRELGR